MYATLKDFIKTVLEIGDFLRRRKLEAPKAALRERFRRCFAAQGISDLQIARLLTGEPPLSAAQVLDEVELLRALTPARLDSVADLFGVQRAWLDGASEKPYSGFSFYKNLPAFLDFLVTCVEQNDNLIFWIAKGSDNDFDTGLDSGRVVCGIRVGVTELEDRIIWRDHPFADTWFWNYPPGRFHLKAMSLIAWQFDITLLGVNVRQRYIDDFLDGKLLVGELLDREAYPQWHPDDYIFTSSESCRANDEDEALRVRSWLTELGLMDHLLVAAGRAELRTIGTHPVHARASSRNGT